MEAATRLGAISSASRTIRSSQNFRLKRNAINRVRWCLTEYGWRSRSFASDLQNSSSTVWGSGDYFSDRAPSLRRSSRGSTPDHFLQR